MLIQNFKKAKIYKYNAWFNAGIKLIIKRTMFGFIVKNEEKQDEQMVLFKQSQSYGCNNEK